MTHHHRPPTIVVCHIRREDEVEITYCDRLTVPDPYPADPAPIAVTYGTHHDIAIYANVEAPADTVQCTDCREAYFAADYFQGV